MKKPFGEIKICPNRVYARRFDTDEVEQAVEKYFNEYNIKADLTAAPLTQFEHPMYLKIFCESKNRDRNTEKQIYVGEQTLFEVFEEYLNQCNRTVCDRLELHPNTAIVQPALNKMAEYLWQNRTRHIPLDKLIHIVDSQSRAELNWFSSKTQAIEAEGLLVYRDWDEVEEAMYFTYDLLGGYLVAKYLIQQATENVQDFLQREETLAVLLAKTTKPYIHCMMTLADVWRHFYLPRPVNFCTTSQIMKWHSVYRLRHCLKFRPNT